MGKKNLSTTTGGKRRQENKDEEFKKPLLPANDDDDGGGGGGDVFVERRRTREEAGDGAPGRFDASGPRFRKPKGLGSSSSNRVVLDERFASVLTDPRFEFEAKDKYGRKKKKKTKKGREKNELSAFYTVEGREDRKEERGADDADDDGGGGGVGRSSGGEEGNAVPAVSVPTERVYATQGKDDPASRIAYLRALSRGELDVSSSSSSSSEEEEEEGDEDDESQSSREEGGGGEDPAFDPVTNATTDPSAVGILDPAARREGENVELTTEPSPYLAVMNLDWSNVRAVDVLAILSSFVPPGAVRTVRVYPSEYGLEMLAKEERTGPMGLWKKEKETHTTDSNLDPVNGGGRRALGDRGEGDGNAEEDNFDTDEEEDDGPLLDAAADADAVLLHGSDRLEEQSDFDPEKLRAYEASKLKYYFAVAEFSSPHHADVAYKEVDGLEFEHSSAAVDLRSVAPSDLDGAVRDRPIRDEASSVPSNYVPPEFVVAALQQTAVRCTWELGDGDRERNLTRYASSGAAWEAVAESDDLRAYLASDASTSSDDGGAGDNDGGDPAENYKAQRMRKLLGLDSDDDDDNNKADNGAGSVNEPNSRSSSSSANDEDDDEDDDGSGSRSGSDGDDGSEERGKQVTFVPGKSYIEEKIRSKLEAKDEEGTRELTPWEKYQRKRKEKRRERRQAARARRNEVNEIRKHRMNAGDQNNGNEEGGDDFFVRDGEGASRKKKEEGYKDEKPKRQTQQQELELLVAGDAGEEEARDYDMRGLQRIEKNRDKKLRGSRKRREAELAAAVTGTAFRMDLKDDRFRAVLDGEDDRFGIDRTDPNYRETAAMKEILAERAKRRRAKKRKRGGSNGRVGSAAVAPTVTADPSLPSRNSAGATALSALVKSLKSKVR